MNHSHQCSCSCHHKHCHSCCHNHLEEEESDDTSQLLELANEAWREVLKEKIKENIRASDHKIDKMANIVAEANRAYWHHKIAASKINEHYEIKLNDLFNQFDQIDSSEQKS